MKYLLSAIFILYSCNEFNNPNKIQKEISPPEVLTDSKANPFFPEGAIKANFIGNQDSLHAFIEKVDTRIKLPLLFLKMICCL